MQYLSLILFIVSIQSFASSKDIKNLPTECGDAIESYKQKIDETYQNHVLSIQIDQLKVIFSVRADLISNGTLETRNDIDNYIAARLAFIFSRDNVREADISPLKEFQEHLLTFPLNVSVELKNEVTAGFNTLGL